MDTGEAVSGFGGATGHCHQWPTLTTADESYQNTPPKSFSRAGRYSGLVGVAHSCE